MSERKTLAPFMNAAFSQNQRLPSIRKSIAHYLPFFETDRRLHGF
jgi:hypothetical protein